MLQVQSQRDLLVLLVHCVPILGEQRVTVRSQH